MDAITITAQTVSNIERLLAAKGWNRARLSERSGIDPPHISRLMSAGTTGKATSLETVARVAAALEVTPDVLLGPPLIPMFDTPVKCGPPGDLPGDIHPAEWVNLGTWFGPADELFILTASGDSMTAARIIEGDQLILRSKSAAKVGQIVLALTDGKTTLKKFGRDGRRFCLLPMSDSDSHEVINLDSKTDARVIGVLVGIIKRMVGMPDRHSFYQQG